MSPDTSQQIDTTPMDETGRVLLSVLLPDLNAGGAERVCVNLANALAARGYRVDMVVMRRSGELLSALSPQVRVVSLDASRVRNALWPLLRYLRSAQPAALLANMWPLTVMAVLARRLSGVRTRIVVAEHNTWSRSELLSRPTVGWQVRTSMHHVFPHADGIVAVSQGAADDLAQFAQIERQSIQVIYNPVVGALPDRATVECGPAEWWQGGHKRLLAVGTLKPIKAYDTLIDAFAKLRAHADARLLILGEGGERAALEAQVKRLDLQGQVFMPGFVKDPGPYYQRADLHVLSSTGEGLPTVMIEALAAGVPVVSTDCPSGPREILADGRFGQLVPVGDAAALADAMAQSLASEHDHDSLKRRAQDFSIDKAVDQYEALLVAGQARKTLA